MIGAAALAVLHAFWGPATPREDAFADRHLRAVRAERTRRFAELWAVAGEARRAAAEELLAELRSPGAPLGARPSLGALARACDLLAGVPPAEGELAGLRAAASALDLRVVPGFFDARSEGRGEPLTVRVELLFPAPPPGDVVLHLYWRAPGGERLRARSEPVAQAAFRRPGFDMYVRAPLSPPGSVWTLEPELERPNEGATARGEPVPVACGRDWSTRLAAQREAAPAERWGRFILAELSALFELGLRGARAPDPELLLAALEAGEAPHPTPALWHEQRRHPGAGRLLPRLWVSGGARDAELVLLLFAPSQEAPEAVFGPAPSPAPAPGWEEVAGELSAALVAAPVDLRSGPTPAAALEWVRRELPGRPIVAVASGDAVARLGFARLRDGSLPVDGRVVGGAAPLLGGADGAPTLWVTPRPPREAPEGVQVEVAGGGSAVEAEFLLAARTRDWLAGGALGEDAETASSRGAGARRGATEDG